MKNTIFLFLMLISTGFVFSQKKEMQSITENELKAHLKFLSGDLMQGRDLGTPTPGLQIAAEYLKTECLKMGLKPGFSNYTQPVKMNHVQTDTTKTKIILKKEDEAIVFESNDIVPYSSSSKNDTLSAKIVFAGYGWNNKDKGYNDLEGLDLKGKIVMIMTRNPELANDTAANENASDRVEMMKLSGLFMSGAKAILFIPDPLNPNTSWFKMAKQFFAKGSYQAEGQKEGFIPGFLLLSGIETANAILKETGKTLEEIQKEINSSMKPASRELQSVSATIILAKKSESIMTENVIGVVEGSDPVLKNECVVLSAHYDHVGVGADGQVNNGADDNGSGTVALLEVAEALMKMDKKPKRSVVFAWVTCEEKGLIGANYYVEHPLFPMEKTVADINLDMVGRSATKDPENLDDINKSLGGPDRIYLIKGKTSSELNAVTDKICKELKLVPNEGLSKDLLNRSDYYHFYRKGVPVIGVTTGLHNEYHRPTDDEALIDYKKMKRVADFTFLTTFEIANRKERIQFDE